MPFQKGHPPYNRKATVSEEGATAVAPEPEASAVPDVSSLIEDVTAKVMAQLQAQYGAQLDALKADNDRLYREVAEAQAQIPQIRPMLKPEDPQVRREKAFVEAMQRKQQDLGERLPKQIPVTVNGQKLDQGALSRFKPKFAPGQTIRVNPAVSKEKWPDGMTWQTVLDQVDSAGVGYVKVVDHMGINGQWRYRCQIPGVCRQNQDIFLDEYELEAC